MRKRRKVEKKKGSMEEERESEGRTGKGTRRKRRDKNNKIVWLASLKLLIRFYLFSFWVSSPITHKVQALGIREQQKLDAEKLKSGSFPIKELTEYLGYTKYKFGQTYTNISISLATYQSIWVCLDEYIYLSSYLPVNVPIIYQCSERKREVKIYRGGEDGGEDA